jgi:hypothetical protein
LALDRVMWVFKVALTICEILSDPERGQRTLSDDQATEGSGIGGQDFHAFMEAGIHGTKHTAISHGKGIYETYSRLAVSTCRPW